MNSLRPKIVIATNGRIGTTTLKSLKQRGVDFLEFRVDLASCRQRKSFTTSLERLTMSQLPLIITIRSVQEGGGHPFSDEERLELYQQAAKFAQFFDVELQSIHLLPDIRKLCRHHKVGLILSHHNFKGTPAIPSLEKLYVKAIKLGADMIKVVTLADNHADMCKLLKWTLSKHRKPCVIMAMGNWGALSRIVLPIAGSAWVYSCLGKPLVKGQIPIKQLSHLLDQFYPRP